MFPGLQPSRRELTPVRLCSVRLSWRQRARPSTTLHEIQICRSRLEYFVCITACGGPQLEGTVARRLYRPGAAGWVYWKGYLSRSQFRRRLYEGLFEVCRQFLDERVSGDGVDGFGPDHVNRKGEEEEERELYDKHSAVGEYEPAPGRRKIGLRWHRLRRQRRRRLSPRMISREERPPQRQR
jgi:hypothetical protein